MKKLKYLTGMIVVFSTLASCDKEPATTDNIIGTWNTNSATITVLIDGKSVLQYLIDEFDYTADEAHEEVVLMNQDIEKSFSGTLQLKTDNTFITVWDGTTGTGTWSLSPNRDKFTMDSGSGQTTTFDIIELTSSVLHLKISFTESTDLNEDGFNETRTATYELTFTK